MINSCIWIYLLDHFSPHLAIRREWYNRLMSKKVGRVATKSIKRVSKEVREYQLAMVGQMLKLATNGFGLVAALAWNNVIKEVVSVYIQPYIGKDSALSPCLSMPSLSLSWPSPLLSSSPASGSTGAQWRRSTSKGAEKIVGLLMRR